MPVAVSLVSKVLFFQSSTNISFPLIDGGDWLKQKGRTRFRVFSFKLSKDKTPTHVGFKDYQNRCSSDMRSILRIFGCLLVQKRWSLKINPSGRLGC